MGGEQLLEKERDIVYYQSAQNPNTNISPIIAGDVHTMEDNQPQNESLSRDTTVFCILNKLSDIINNLNQQLHEEKVQNRSLAKVNLEFKLEIYKRKLAEQLGRSKTFLEASEIQQKSGINFSMESKIQTRVSSIKISPFFKTIPERGKDAQFTSMITTLK